MCVCVCVCAECIIVRERGYPFCFSLWYCVLEEGMVLVVEGMRLCVCLCVCVCVCVCVKTHATV